MSILLTGAVVVPVVFFGYKGISLIIETKGAVQKGIKKVLKHQNPTNYYHINEISKEKYLVSYAVLVSYVESWPTVKAFFVKRNEAYILENLELSNDLSQTMDKHPELEKDIDRLLGHMKTHALPAYENAKMGAQNTKEQRKRRMKAFIERTNGVEKTK